MGDALVRILSTSRNDNTCRKFYSPLMRNKAAWQSIARVGLSIAALATIFLATQFDEVIGALARADVSFIAAGILINLLTRLAAAERTYVISRAVGLPLTRWRTIEAMFISNFWSLALPGLSAGSVVTVYRYTRLGVPLADSVGVLGASRAIELAAFCALGAVAFVLSASTPSVLVTASLCLVPVGIACSFLIAPQIASRAADVIGGSAPRGRIAERLAGTLSRAVATFSAAPRRELFAAAGFALVQCSLDAASVMIFSWGLGFRIDWLDALWINVLAYLVILLPISVAGLGVREAAVIVALTPLGVSREGAIALALLMFSATLFNALLGGVLQLFSRPTKGTV